MSLRLVLLALTLAATTVAAEAPDTSLRPEGRISSSNQSAATRPQLRPDIAEESIAENRPVLRPVARSQTRPLLARGAYTRAQARAETDLFAFSPNAPLFSLRPTVRPAVITRRAQEERAARRRGQICGDPALQGEAIGRVNGPGRCGIDSAVKVRAVAGVTLSPRATIDCRTASALKTWVESSLKPSVGGMGGGVDRLRVVSHYSCRNRNSLSSGRLSEHSFGHAIDIAGIGLKSGREITVLTDWGRGAEGRALRQMWRGACGPFGTVLGPEANRFHRDHFHFDTARYRSGPYCR